MMILRTTKQIRKMLGRSLLLRILLNTRILVPSTTERCLHIARGLVNAAIPCKARLLTQSSSCEAPFYARGARGSEGAYWHPGLQLSAIISFPGLNFHTLLK